MRRLLLECSELPPYSAAVQQATELPEFDFTSMIELYAAGLRRTALKDTSNRDTVWLVVGTWRRGGCRSVELTQAGLRRQAGELVHAPLGDLARAGTVEVGLCDFEPPKSRSSPRTSVQAVVHPSGETVHCGLAVLDLDRQQQDQQPGHGQDAEAGEEAPDGEADGLEQKCFAGVVNVFRPARPTGSSWTLTIILEVGVGMGTLLVLVRNGSDRRGRR